MDVNAKRFARRILAIHLALLIIVLATVAEAAREIYTRTREQMIAQAEERQKLLAKETTSGIQSHYQSILNDLDLVHRAENEQTDPAVPAIDRPAQTLLQRANDRALGSRAPIIGQVMWKQLDGRVSLLFSIDHQTNSRLTQDNHRYVPPPPPADTGSPALPPDVHLIGTNDTRLNLMSILRQNRRWIDQLKEPSFNHFDNYNGVGENLVCIPMTRGRDLVAVVPIRAVEQQFLQPLNDDPANGAWLVDEAGTAMAASRPDLVGISVTNMADRQLQALATQYIRQHASGTTELAHSFRIGAARFAPAMITARPVVIANKQWELFVTTSLDDVDGVVARLMHRAPALVHFCCAVGNCDPGFNRGADDPISIAVGASASRKFNAGTRAGPADSAGMAARSAPAQRSRGHRSGEQPGEPHQW